jgi:hypothetical protein
VSKTHRKTPAATPPTESPGPATQEITTDPQAPEQTSYDPASGCLLRLFWMMLGNLALLAAAYGIVENSAASFGLADVFYWAIVGALLWARYADIRYMNGRTAEGQPATMAHCQRYAVILVAVSTGLWIIAHVLARLLG